MRPLLDEDGLREVAARGVSVGSHGSTHRRLTELPGDKLEAELRGSRQSSTTSACPTHRVLIPIRRLEPRPGGVGAGRGLCARVQHPSRRRQRRGRSIRASPDRGVRQGHRADPPLEDRDGDLARLAAEATASTAQGETVIDSLKRALGRRIAVPLLRARARRRLSELRPGEATVVTVNWNSWPHLETLIDVVTLRSPPTTRLARGRQRIEGRIPAQAA